MNTPAPPPTPQHSHAELSYIHMQLSTRCQSLPRICVLLGRSLPFMQLALQFTALGAWGQYLPGPGKSDVLHPGFGCRVGKVDYDQHDIEYSASPHNARPLRPTA